MVWSCGLIMSDGVFKLVWALSTLGSISIVIKCRFRLIRMYNIARRGYGFKLSTTTTYGEGFY